MNDRIDEVLDALATLEDDNSFTGFEKFPGKLIFYYLNAKFKIVKSISYESSKMIGYLRFFHYNYSDDFNHKLEPINNLTFRLEVSSGFLSIYIQHSTKKELHEIIPSTIPEDAHSIESLKEVFKVTFRRKLMSENFTMYPI